MRASSLMISLPHFPLLPSLYSFLLWTSLFSITRHFLKRLILLCSRTFKRNLVLRRRLHGEEHLLLLQRIWELCSNYQVAPNYLAPQHQRISIFLSTLQESMSTCTQRENNTYKHTEKELTFKNWKNKGNIADLCAVVRPLIPYSTNELRVGTFVTVNDDIKTSCILISTWHVSKKPSSSDAAALLMLFIVLLASGKATTHSVLCLSTTLCSLYYREL